MSSDRVVAESTEPVVDTLPKQPVVAPGAPTAEPPAVVEAEPATQAPTGWSPTSWRRDQGDA